MRTHERLTLTDFRRAKPADEPDRARVKWPVQKHRLPRGKTQTVPATRRYLRTKAYYSVLRMHGRDVTKCEECGSGDRINIHHLDLVHGNNSIENLVVLCAVCHKKRHLIDDVPDEFEGTHSDSE